MTLENVESPQEGTSEQAAPEFSPVELEAMELGWRPKEEFQGDEGKFIDAKEFVGRKSLYDKIEAQKNEIKTIRQGVDALKQHYAHVETRAFEKALKQLEAQQKQAVRDGDADSFESIESQKKALEAERQEFIDATEQIKTEAPQVHPELQAWVNRNPWYSKEPHMQLFADRLGQRLAASVSAGEITQKQALEKISAAVKEEFPNKFRNPNRDKPSAVEATSKHTSSKPNSSFKMTSEQELVWKSFERSGLMSKADYIDSLKKYGA
jgi:hypothetical protein